VIDVSEAEAQVCGSRPRNGRQGRRLRLAKVVLQLAHRFNRSRAGAAVF